MSDFIPIKGSQENIDNRLNLAGQLLFATDTKRLYLDVDNKTRIQITDFIDLDAMYNGNIPNNYNYYENKLYIKDSKLQKWNSTTRTLESIVKKENNFIYSNIFTYAGDNTISEFYDTNSHLNIDNGVYGFFIYNEPVENNTFVISKETRTLGICIGTIQDVIGEDKPNHYVVQIISDDTSFINQPDSVKKYYFSDNRNYYRNGSIKQPYNAIDFEKFVSHASNVLFDDDVVNIYIDSNTNVDISTLNTIDISTLNIENKKIKNINFIGCDKNSSSIKIPNFGSEDINNSSTLTNVSFTNLTIILENDLPDGTPNISNCTNLIFDNCLFENICTFKQCNGISIINSNSINEDIKINEISFNSCINIKIKNTNNINKFTFLDDTSSSDEENNEPILVLDNIYCNEIKINYQSNSKKDKNIILSNIVVNSSIDIKTTSYLKFISGKLIKEHSSTFKVDVAEDKLDLGTFDYSNAANVFIDDEFKYITQGLSSRQIYNDSKVYKTDNTSEDYDLFYRTQYKADHQLDTDTFDNTYDENLDNSKSLHSDLIKIDDQLQKNNSKIEEVKNSIGSGYFLTKGTFLTQQGLDLNKDSYEPGNVMKYIGEESIILKYDDALTSETIDSNTNEKIINNYINIEDEKLLNQLRQIDTNLKMYALNEEYDFEDYHIINVTNYSSLPETPDNNSIYKLENTEVIGNNTYLENTYYIYDNEWKLYTNKKYIYYLNIPIKNVDYVNNSKLCVHLPVPNETRYLKVFLDVSSINSKYITISFDKYIFNNAVLEAALEYARNYDTTSEAPELIGSLINRTVTGCAVYIIDPSINKNHTGKTSNCLWGFKKAEDFSNSSYLISYIYEINLNKNDRIIRLEGNIWDKLSGNSVEISDELIYSGDCGDNATWSLFKSGLLKIEGIGDMYDYEWYDDNAYNTPWYNYKEQIKKVEIKSGITSIGTCAFISCTKLNSINIPNSVIHIGGDAFHNCTELTNVIIPDSVIDISYAFNGCTKLTNIKLSNNLTDICDDAFAGCSSLIGIDIPNKVTKIGIAAFSSCTNLSYINLPNGSDDATSENVIDVGAFDFCTSLSDVYYPNATSESDIKWTIGTSNTPFESAIKHYGKAYINGYEVITLKSSDDVIEIISNGTCGNNVSWTLYSNGLLDIQGVNSDSTMSDFIYNIENDAYNTPWYNYRTQIKTVKINNINNIGDNAFYDCTSILSVYISNSVTSIGYCTFSGCTKLTNIIIPTSVTSIDISAFSNCRELTSIIIPDGVTSINDGTFAFCYSLTSINIPNSVTSIGMGAFQDCKSLVNITIPASITSIGNDAFLECTSLVSINIPNSVTSIGIGAFQKCISLSHIDIPDSISIISGAAFADCISLSHIDISNSISTISEAVFTNCTNLTTINMPLSVSSISKNAFYGCTKLSDVYYPDASSSDEVSYDSIGNGNEKFINAIKHYGKAYIDGYAISINKQVFTNKILSVNNWSNTIPYTQEIIVDITSDANPIISYGTPATENAENYSILLNNFGLIDKAIAGNGKITFYCYRNKPTADIPLIIKEI